jgi:hypothetical protein
MPDWERRRALCPLPGAGEIAGMQPAVQPRLHGIFRGEARLSAAVGCAILGGTAG